ncbi:MAG: gluconate 2-dehydrogenase subunit 3 family protein [Gammaproteobacteria bacterium]|nr:gluconate 2-dehydrogenase subunit 3 family protein [Gammaproteobacteria bacterium]MBP6229017.1 gluconate 2-dehydrogenase subunit 3 family protein [Pseudomonadales bacterium]MBK6581813.1 gluconate 2-dehydrogenase subunit 3 family protein [Gammaproteobacteria bacterium]MBK7169480.1 gluconate 2-dehydrogenase subunit 3 family protein [Gammaproteobacteria bacterium]MBK7520648.1 gluconate 2-dehydrogenase subunit 3 family protein [Gammaproteobacteria bacterium]
MMNRRKMLLAVASAMGGAMLGSATLRVLAGEVPAAAASRALFDANTSQLVSVLAEMIIPETDTPGAIAAGTPQFIEMMVADWYTDIERGIFFDGLKQLDTFCKASLGTSFIEANAKQRIAALDEAENQAAAYVSPFPGGTVAAAISKIVDENTPFFAKLKELTVIGYYSSEVGAKLELAYNPMPMRYEGDYAYVKTGGRQWSY